MIIINSLKVADLEKEKMFATKNEELNYPPYVAAQRDVEYWSTQGLAKRAVIVRSQYVDNCTWTLKEVASFIHTHLYSLLGIYPP